MKTEISKQFHWGFILREAEIRRIMQACDDNAKKISSDDYVQKITIHLKDGSIIETQDLDEILGLENIGSKSVEKLSIEMEQIEKENNEWNILVSFQNGYYNKKNWTSVEYEISGEQRDWVFITSSEIEERIKRCRIISLDYIAAHRWFMIIPLFLGVLVSISVSNHIGPEKDIADSLQSAYESGTVKNAIEALIHIERIKNARSFVDTTLPFCIAFVTPLFIFYLLASILPKIYPSYNFYWGDYIPYFDKRKNAIRIIWIVIILGILVSIVAGIILRYF